jgi:hypothetical protein
MRLIDADVLKQHIDKLPALPDGNFAGTHRSLKALINMQPTVEPSTNCPEIPDSWIPCSRKMPEEHEWIGTKQFGTTISDEVYVTFENPKGERFTRHLSFQNGKVPNFEQRTIDAFYKGSVPIAWKQKPKPWEGEKHE